MVVGWLIAISFFSSSGIVGNILAWLFCEFSRSITFRVAFIWFSSLMWVSCDLTACSTASWTVSVNGSFTIWHGLFAGLLRTGSVAWIRLVVFVITLSRSMELFAALTIWVVVSGVEVRVLTFKVLLMASLIGPFIVALIWLFIWLLSWLFRMFVKQLLLISLLIWWLICFEMVSLITLPIAFDAVSVFSAVFEPELTVGWLDLLCGFFCFCSCSCEQFTLICRK